MDLENIELKLVIVSSVFPDFETIIKHEFFIFFIFLYFKIKFVSKLSKKNTFLFTLFSKNEKILLAPRIDPPIPKTIMFLYLENFFIIDFEKSNS